MSAVTFEVDDAGFTSVSSATSLTFSTRLNEAGEARVSVPASQSTDATRVMTSNRRGLVKVGGTSRFAGRAKPQTRNFITRDGAARWVEASYPGIVSEWADATVLEPFGPATVPTASTRVFNWASNEIDDDTWGSAFTIVAGVIGIDGRPWAFPDPLASRIWTASGSDLRVYCRRRLSVTAGTVTPFFTASRGWHRQWIGGVAVLEGEQPPMPSDEFARRSVPRWAASGTGVFAVESEKLFSDTPWLSAAVYGLASATTGELNTSTFLSHTGLTPGPGPQDPWKISATPTGPTPGRIIRALLEEAQAQGLLTEWTLNFSDSVDSAGNVWDPVVEVSFPVGLDLYSALVQLAETDIDFAAPEDGSRVLSAWRWRERGGFHSGGYETTLSGERFGTASGRVGNLAELDFVYQEAAPTKLHVRWERGSFITGSGSVMRSVQLQSSTLAAAEADAAAIIAGGDSEAVGTSVVASVVPRNGDDVPLVDFGIGDGVRCPDETGTLTTYRCVGVTVEAARNAEARYVVELSSPLAERASNAARWLARVQPGGLGGISPVSGTASDLGSGIPSGVLSEIHAVTANMPGAVVLDTSDPWPASQRVRLYRFATALATAGSTSTMVKVAVNGADVHTVVIPASYTEHDGFMGDIYLTKGDVLTLEVTAAGTGAEGLVVECFATEAI